MMKRVVLSTALVGMLNLFFATVSYAVEIQVSLTKRMYISELGICSETGKDLKKHTVTLSKYLGKLNRCHGSVVLDIPVNSGKVEVIVSYKKGISDDGSEINHRGVSVVDFFNEYHSPLGEVYSQVGMNELHPKLSGTIPLMGSNSGNGHRCGFAVEFSLPAESVSQCDM